MRDTTMYDGYRPPTDEERRRGLWVSALGFLLVLLTFLAIALVSESVRGLGEP